MRGAMGCLPKLTLLVLLSLCSANAQSHLPDQAQVIPLVPTLGPPAPDATAQQLEDTGDQLRARKAYLESIDYFRAALNKHTSAQLYNKVGIVELQTYHLADARKDFERSIKIDKKQADALNNLGV